MNFNELTRIMLSSMDFFELRRTAARYGVPFQGVRRSKLVRDLERKITAKNQAAGGQVAINSEDLPQDLTSASSKRSKKDKNAGHMTTINTISSGNAVTRFQE